MMRSSSASQPVVDGPKEPARRPPREGGPASQNRPAIIFLVAVALVVVSIGLAAMQALAPYISQPTRDLSEDVDWRCINSGLDRIDGFADTSRWWTGTWCGEVPFWRPLTSYVFWGMRLLWAKEYLLPRQIILVALHLCFVGMAGLLLQRLTRRPWLVLLALWLFVGLRPGLMVRLFGRVGPVCDVLRDPKNIPDPLVGIAVLASLLLLSRGKWLSALIAATLSVGFKEQGFMTWPLALLVLAWVHRDRVAAPDRVRYLMDSIRRNRPAIAVWLITFVLLSVVHFVAVGIGFRQGTNWYWWWRALVYLGGPVGISLLSVDRAAPVIALLLVAIMLGARRLSLILRLAGVLLVIAVGILVDVHVQGAAWHASLARVFSFECMLHLIIICVLWLLVVWEARHDWQTVAFGAAACLVSSLPTWMAAQTMLHTLYLSSLFMGLAVAAALCQAAKATARTWSNMRIRSNGSAASR